MSAGGVSVLSNIQQVGNIIGIDNTGSSTNIRIGRNNFTSGFGDSGYNIAIGVEALEVITTASATDNIGIGRRAGEAITTGDKNIAIGSSCGKTTTTGSNNITIGEGVAEDLTTGSSNICIGTCSGMTTVAALEGCTLVGHESGVRCQGNYNTFVGYQAGKRTSGGVTGTSNVVLGKASGTGLTTGSRNILIGQNTGTTTSTGADNIVMGKDCGDNLTTGSNNILIGTDAGTGNSPLDVSTQSNVIVLGDNNITDLYTKGTVHSSTGFAADVTGASAEGVSTLRYYVCTGSAYKKYIYHISGETDTSLDVTYPTAFSQPPVSSYNASSGSISSVTSTTTVGTINLTNPTTGVIIFEGI